MKIVETNITTLHDIVDFFLQTYSAKQSTKRVCTMSLAHDTWCFNHLQQQKDLQDLQIRFC